VTGHEKAIAALALSSTGDLIASGGDDNRVVLYGLDNRFALNRDIT
jgi:WD40 repeat protein